jgi:hypothetical protein
MIRQMRSRAPIRSYRPGRLFAGGSLKCPTAKSRGGRVLAKWRMDATGVGIAAARSSEMGQRVGNPPSPPNPGGQVLKFVVGQSDVAAGERPVACRVRPGARDPPTAGPGRIEEAGDVVAGRGGRVVPGDDSQKPAVVDDGAGEAADGRWRWSREVRLPSQSAWRGSCARARESRSWRDGAHRRYGLVRTRTSPERDGRSWSLSRFA